MNQPENTSNTGILIMAHGGGTTWNRMVKEAARPLIKKYPVEFAWGMANFVSIQKAVQKLETQSIDRILVIPLFISKHSPILRQAEYLLGLRDELADPPMPVMHYTDEFVEMSGVDIDDSHFMHNMLFPPSLNPVEINTPVEFTDALDDHPIVAQILRDRILALSKHPEQETVVLAAHGPNGEEDNTGWVQSMESLAAQVQEMQRETGAAFRHITALTVRDDAPEAIHEQAKQHLRAAVRQGNISGEAIVIPVFLSPGGREKSITKRLEGLSFKWSGETLLPDARLTDFLVESVKEAYSRQS
ncbi:sirohydrochlorin chelatase [Gracilimonas mengyeensis]|uniref:Sirohydrochlorin ferrochelatase n=1 Tax=Gracilimonas mengyeensis TaxID=1302730 RepID=A0A521B1I4_9BACT|nr:CbiX/SirB N-terminal domain-containing protein [Gracilimonas mengyeensis]SMO40906.1 Sirohydrochlorin ferrochelatase [Gracilimonas mengyeensis]